MKTSRTGVGIGLVLLVAAAVIALAIGRPQEAIAPGLMAVVLGVVRYQEWRRSLRSPRVWTRRRTTAAILVTVPVSIATLAAFAWLTQQDAWPNPLLGWIGLAYVVVALVRLVLNARREDRLARQPTKQDTPTV